jgi:hypothetical protein
MKMEIVMPAWMAGIQGDRIEELGKCGDRE